MNQEEALKLNKTNWNRFSKTQKAYTNTSLPEYGPFTPDEDTLQLFKNVKGKKVLEIGCAEGKSLLYLANKGASELHGLDFSDVQIENAKAIFEEKQVRCRFYVSPMEVNPGIPTDFFDYVYSIYGIGWSVDIKKTLGHIASYLKKDGVFIFSWTHPTFLCLKETDNGVVFDKPYNKGDIQTTTYKGEDKLEMVIYHWTMSTYINSLIEAGLVIDRIIEKVSQEKIDQNIKYGSGFFTAKKAKLCPTTLIIQSHKK